MKSNSSNFFQQHGKVIFAALALGTLAVAAINSAQHSRIVMRKPAIKTVEVLLPDSPAAVAAGTQVKAKKVIRIALLLDTSSSMDGLIEQAKSQLWKLVNQLSFSRYGATKPELELALYEYGNDGISSRKDWIRMVTPFTNDLDLVSEKLFALKTNG